MSITNIILYKSQKRTYFADVKNYSERNEIKTAFLLFTEKQVEKLLAEYDTEKYIELFGEVEEG